MKKIRKHIISYNRENDSMQYTLNSILIYFRDLYSIQDSLLSEYMIYREDILYNEHMQEKKELCIGSFALRYMHNEK